MLENTGALETNDKQEKSHNKTDCVLSCSSSFMVNKKMATSTETSRNYCFICEKEKSTYTCDGCSKRFCKQHLKDHENELESELNQIENERNIFRQTLSEQVEQPNKHHLIQQIDRWEQLSINKIQQTAEKNRQVILKQMNKHFENIEIDLNLLTNQIKEIRQESDFNELNLIDLRNKLERLQKKLNSPSNISVREGNSSSLFINRIYVDIDLEMLDIPINLKWKQDAITVAGGNGQDQELNQLNKPWSIYIDNEKTIYIADQCNHRIIAWKKDATCGEIVAGGNGQGRGNHQLSYPTEVIIDEVNDSLIIADRGNKRVVRWPRRNGSIGEVIIKDVRCIDLIMHKNEYLYICDDEKQEVRRWKIGENEGVLVAGGNGCGDGLNQLNNPRFICVDQEDTLYVSDWKNHRVMKWMKGSKEGIVVAGGQGPGASLKQLSYPQGIFIDKLDTVYVAEAGNDRVVRWIKGAKEGSIIAGGNSRGTEPNQFYLPYELSFDDENSLYIVDSENHRIQKFVVDNLNQNFDLSALFSK